MIPLSEPTHHQTLIYVDNVALSSLIVFVIVFFFSFPPGNCAHLQLFLHFISAVPHLLLIATDEDYCRVVETSGFHMNG